MINLLQKLTSIFNRRSTGELKTVTDALSSNLNVIVDDLKLLNMEYIISTATGEWLDEWGTWFGLSRKTGETDSQYSSRIIATVAKSKLTIPALIYALKSVLGENATIDIYEPYRDLAKFSESAFSSHSKLTGGDYYRHHVIDVILYDTNYSDEAAKVVLKIKSAGIVVWFSRLQSFDIIEIKPTDTPDGCLLSVYLEKNFFVREHDDTLMFSVYGANFSGAPMSGRQVLSHDYIHEHHMQVPSMQIIYPGSLVLLDLIKNNTPKELNEESIVFEVSTL